MPGFYEGLPVVVDAASADGELLARLRGGDAAAFAELLDQHGGMVLAVARRILHHEEDARDATQEAFVSAFRAIDRFDGSARLSTWLYRIAANAALMKLRSRSRRPECSIVDLQPQFVSDGHHRDVAIDWPSESADSAERAELHAAVHQAIAELPEDYRTVVLLRDIEGFDTEQAAGRLGVSISVVKTRLHRARLALRAILDRRFREDWAC